MLLHQEKKKEVCGTSGQVGQGGLQVAQTCSAWKRARVVRQQLARAVRMFPFPTGFHGYGHMGMGGHGFGMMTFEERYHAVPVAAADKTDTSVSVECTQVGMA